MSASSRRRLLSAAVATAALSGALLLSSGSAFATDTPPATVDPTSTAGPTNAPTPTQKPTGEPTSRPTAGPTGEPTTSPTGEPADTPTTAPTSTPPRTPTASAPATPEAGSKAPKPTTQHCYVEKTIKSALPYLTVKLVNSKADGPSASLMKGDKKVVTVNRTSPVNLGSGIRIINPDSARPVFQQRSQGGPTPWTSIPFPKLPENCFAVAQAGKPVQTTVVPVGAVAAGAELNTGDGVAYRVAGGALAMAGVAGLGFVVTRRRREQTTSF